MSVASSIGSRGASVSSRRATRLLAAIDNDVETCRLQELLATNQQEQQTTSMVTSWKKVKNPWWT